MNIFFNLLLLIFMVSTSVLAGEIYKCNIDGKVVYTDESCKGEVVELKNRNSVSTEQYGKYYNSSTWYNEYTGYVEALKVSEKKDVPLFIYFHADWCGYCRKLERELIDTSGASVSLSKVVKVKISPESGLSEKQLFERLGGSGYPTVFIQSRFDSSPKKLNLMERVSGEWRTKSVTSLTGIIDREL